MKKTRLVFTLLLLLTTIGYAANKYVSPGGSGNGSSWSSPGGVSIINSSASGDVIYLAGGNYGNGFRIDVGSITIKRATAADHGADAGWQAAMDSQAVFNSGIGVSKASVTIDGNCWKPPGLPNKFGIKIKFANGAKGIDAGGAPSALTVRDVECEGPGINASKKEADGIHLPGSSLITGCSVHDTDALLFSWKGNSGTTIEYCLLYNASSNIVFSGNPQDPHPDVLLSGGMFTNGIMRWCMVANVTSEGVFFDRELPGDNMEFYGNIMFEGDSQNGNTPIQFQNGAKFGKVLTYNNTFVDFSKSNIIGPGTTLGAGSAVVNNLFINYLPNWPTGVSNNGFSGTGIGSNQIVNAASPFVTSGTHVWTKGSGKPPAARRVTGAPQGYNPQGMEAAFVLASNSWANGKAVSVPAGRNVDMFGKSGNALGALQSGTTSPAPEPTATPEATPNPTPAPTPPPVGEAKFKAGDVVSPDETINIRATPAGEAVGQHHPPDVGTIVSGPVGALFNGVVVNWYLIDWMTAPPEGYSGDDHLAKSEAPPTPEPTPAPEPTPPPIPEATPEPTPPSTVTYKEWTLKLNAAHDEWIEKHPPYPDGE